MIGLLRRQAGASAQGSQVRRIDPTGLHQRFSTLFQAEVVKTS
jgi:hypothetical protein